MAKQSRDWKADVDAIRRLLIEDIYDQTFFWQGHCCNVSHDEEQPCWLVAVSTPFMVMVHRVFDHKPDADALWDVLLEAMKVPQIGSFRRPRRLRVKPNEGWERLEAPLQEVGIALETCTDLEPVDGWPERIDQAYTEWDKHRTKWKVLRRDDNGNVLVVEKGLTREEAECSAMVENLEDNQSHWVEREEAGDC